MDQDNEVLFPKEFSKVLSSSKTQVYEVEILFRVGKFSPATLLKNGSYEIIIKCLRKIREIKINRGFIYHEIEMDSIMSYNSWERRNKDNVFSADFSYNTFWFNLFPISQKHAILISIESNLMNPHQYSINKNEKSFNQKVNESVEVLMNLEPPDEKKAE
jgi:hypothetical protein